MKEMKERKKKHTFKLMVQGDNNILAKLFNPKSNHNSNFFLSIVIN
jgi:hypothetical protein